MDVVHRIRQIRIERKYSQEDIAAILNTTQQQYSKYENETNEIPVRHVITLCKFYKISSDWLLGLSEER
jgi:transcriptional regulator with XRE-family HTH domain